MESAYDDWVDHLLTQDGQVTEGWAFGALFRALRRGPDRKDLRSTACRELDPADLVQHEGNAAKAELRERLLARIAERLDLLTRAERSAVHASLQARSMARAADAAGMTRRDLRVRLRRAIQKLGGAGPD